jgi:hypothetical protein
MRFYGGSLGHPNNSRVTPDSGTILKIEVLLGALYRFYTGSLVDDSKR